MICVCIAPKSRTLARVDLHNAASKADIVELALDQLLNPPDVREIISGCEKPVIVSCRTPAEGGHYAGSEDERNALLRQAVIAEPDSIELSLEAAQQIRPFGQVKRLVSFYLDPRSPLNRDDILQAAKDVKADVIKLVAPANTLAQVWPMLKLMFSKSPLPIVGMAEGAISTLVALVARKFQSPWTYAALEPGMEIFAGQPTIFSLDEIYDWRRIKSTTRFAAITGDGAEAVSIAEVLGRGIRKLDLDVAAIPVPDPMSASVLKMLRVLKTRAVCLTSSVKATDAELIDEAHSDVEKTGMASVLMRQQETWHGHNMLWRGMLKALESQLPEKTDGSRPLDGKQVLVLGKGPIARSACHALSRRNAVVSIAAADSNAATALATEFNSRVVPFATLFDMMPEVIIHAAPELQPGVKRGELNPSFFRAGTWFLDISRLPLTTPMSIEARERGCKIIDPSLVLNQMLAGIISAFTGNIPSAEIFERSAGENQSTTT